MSEYDRLHAPAVRGLDLIAVVLLTAGLLLLLRALVAGPPISVEFVLAMLALQSLVPIAVVYFVIVRGRGISWQQIGLRPMPRLWYSRSVLIGLVCLPLAALASFLMQSLADTPFRNPQIDVVAPEGFTWRGLLGMLAMAGLVAPFVEEIVFRGLLYAWLRRHMRIAAAVALSALAFAFAHGVIILVPALLITGTILALAYERSGSLWSSIIVHSTFNVVMVGTLYAALAAGVDLTAAAPLR